MASVYVGTYAKYNAGSIGGKWLDLEDYADWDEFMDACRELHEDEDDPEFMFQDHEGVPECFIGESYVKPELWDYLDSRVDDDVKAAYMASNDEWDEVRCNESYIGEFRSDTDLAYQIADDHGILSQIPENLQCYFDFGAYGRDLRLDVYEQDGHYFWRQ